MQARVSLNDLYMQFVAGLLSKAELEGLIFGAIRDNLHHFNLARWNRADCDDYLSWLYPRISRAIDAYHYTGASFDSYIAAVVKWSAKEYRAHDADASVYEYAAWTTRLSEQYAQEEEPEYEAGPPPETASPPNAAIRQADNPRQLLMLVLKCYNCVSDDFIQRLAPRLGIEKGRLKQMLEKMEKLRLERDNALCIMRERVHCQFYRCIMYEKRLAVMSGDSACYLRTKAQLERARLRLASMRERYARMRLGATNGEIAEVLGLTKGAVDSGLHALKNKWNSDPNNSLLN